MILIVEDEPPIAMLERRILEDSGFRVQEAHRGDRALAQLEENSVDIVLLDYRLPDMTGADVVAALGERIQSLPVVMVTGYAQPELIQKMLGIGIAEYLVKDTNLEFLRKLPVIVEDVLSRYN